MKKFLNFKSLTFQVISGIILGIICGALFPKFGAELKVLADIFIKMIKMIIAPIIFLTIVVGIAGMGDMKKLGRIGGKALLYFEIVSTIALAIGITVANVFKPGKGFDTSAASADAVAQYTKAAEETSHGLMNFILSIIPDTFLGAFTNGQLLPVLFVAILFGIALAQLGEKGQPILNFFEKISEVMFGIVNIIMKVSPIGAFGAMAYTIGNFGLGSLVYLGKLMGSVYTTMFLFIVLVLGAIAKFYKFNIFKFIAYIKEEIFLVVGTSSSESALPPMMKKLEKYGCSKSVVGLVLPTGYSFNLDGTSIYLSMAALFIAQAFGVDLSLGDQLLLLGVLMLTSKGAAGVTGSGFVTLAATLAVFPSVPVAGLALILGVDRFMSEARAVTNLIGNGVATVIVSKMEGEFTPQLQGVPSKKDEEVSA
ncbi:C4-dicarboxylate transporter DctA [Schinkia azotoformans]|uniref:C4-dicarboxylate transporter DctA n=1 Tax=Schinkia azotoformans LMG 9581 TaxID=1131731 RepID=K6D7R5_SCHAZ|nr:C4-dicarboxylate transporter DctA [Schinkia azotoformans]EKN64123.1 C4-dicarboxylate transporter DctA [Schinkia azotoformans LMG 9581]MEC1637123.1 C4-dicarboxylate transporter DctA [Schinkia azotoformans]MEC1719850.1 C4-dicarboxylate transporter DctA [Schinkia azotoformans]MEC1945431.1 C4-dicarboxylate transporter DctA [Schinkia azotoformans]MED4351276.1 C4-dicarboxylate transporter DctA [Schinkia azotoformans]